MPIALIEAIAERNVHIREMLELKRVADRVGVPSESVNATLEDWTRDWIDRNPRLGALLSQRHG